ncbi:tRNA (adenine(22)-N(1))-methyltransferase TrmK [Salipaludibacillus sp. LMS25]|uniref:tRNA (adenine(22)-N(1))-methyltransferase n=1 Tax=Salipaludibacillus sp. LMS25 TaxID=2924031 RepID=UPI0020D01E50|nr:tRNA (adenine(22)-N(1))-methyltransferase TrmK [Salipaludibacillus sp. LMS25]UTR17072.1 tRNA (adenine(22)-N(1))-methyltransferase TrmK [Salipaludibacillus sp. LMS25]
MNHEKLSKRLKRVSDHVPFGARVGDIGSDHAYLAVYLVQSGKCPFVVAGEVNKGPLSSAKAHICSNGLTDKINAKLGNGLEVLENEDINTVVIAGMGGPLITTILEEGKERLDLVERLVLQPNVAADHIRRWLMGNNWDLIDEEILEEDGHVYEILVAEKGSGLSPYEKKDLEKQLWLGPYLLKNKNTAFEKKWKRERQQIEKINQQLAFSGKNELLKEKKQQLSLKMTWLEEEL